MRALTLIKRIAEIQKMDSLYIPLQLQQLQSTFGIDDRDLTAHELYQVFKAILTPLVSINSKQPSQDTANMFQWIYYIFNAVFMDMLNNPTGETFCDLTAADESSIYTLFKAMQDFNILTEFTFDLIHQNPQYALMIMRMDDYKDLVLAGHQLQVNYPLGMIIENNPQIDSLHVCNEDEDTFIYVIDINSAKPKKINITANVSTDLQQKLGTMRSDHANDSITHLTLEDYVSLKKIISKHGFRLQNKLTPMIFKLFFIDLPAVIIQAVENHFINQQIDNHRKCQISMDEKNFAQRFEKNTEIQLATQNSLKDEFSSHFRAVYFSRVKTYPSFYLIQEATSLIDFSQLTYTDVYQKAAVVVKQQPVLTMITSLFGRPHKPLPIIIPGTSATTAKRHL
jgi:hypothetical protein